MMIRTLLLNATNQNSCRLQLLSETDVKTKHNPYSVCHGLSLPSRMTFRHRWKSRMLLYAHGNVRRDWTILLYFHLWNDVCSYWYGAKTFVICGTTFLTSVNQSHTILLQNSSTQEQSKWQDASKLQCLCYGTM